MNMKKIENGLNKEDSEISSIGTANR